MNLNENYMYLFEDTLLEDLDRQNRHKWKIILACMKYVDIDSYKNAFPDDKDLSRKEIVKKLRDKLNRLPDETKSKLIHSREVTMADSKFKPHRAGKIAGGVAGGAAAGTGAAVTATGAYVTGAGIAAASSISSAAGSLSGIEGVLAAMPLTMVGASVGAVAIAAGIIIGVGGLALTALGLTGIAVGVKLSNKKNNRDITMMTQNEIIAELKKEEQALKKEIDDPKKLKIVSSQEKPIKKLTPKLA